MPQFYCISHVMQILFSKCIHLTNISYFQTKYKKSGRQEAGSCLYSVMAETLDTQHAKQASQLQSQVHNYAPDLIILDSPLMLLSCSWNTERRGRRSCHRACSPASHEPSRWSTPRKPWSFRVKWLRSASDHVTSYSGTLLITVDTGISAKIQRKW